jgi:hypothetical protein
MAYPTLKDLINEQGILRDNSRSIFLQALYNSLPELIKAISFKAVLSRAEVLDIDFEGGKFYEDSPRNAIKASVYDPTNSFSDVSFPDGSIFYSAIDPFIQLPLKIGETVYVFYESNKSNDLYSGVWFCRVSEPLSNQAVNYINSSDKFNSGLSNKELESNMNVDSLNDQNADEFTLYNTSKSDNYIDSAYSSVGGIDPRTGAEQSRSVHESVPRFIKRGDDLVLMGSNNNMVVFQVDRPGDINSGLNKKSSGAIDIICGRRGWREDLDGKQITEGGKQPQSGISKSDRMSLMEGNPDFIRDRVRNYVCMNCDGDSVFNTTSHLMKSIDGETVLLRDKGGSTLFSVPSGEKDSDSSWDDDFNENIDKRTNDTSFSVVKADCIRNIARHSVKVESLNQARTVDDDGNTTNNFVQTTDGDEKSNIGSSITLNPNGVILIETQNKKGTIRIDPNDANKFVDISVKDLPQHDPNSKSVGSIVMKPDGEIIIDSKKEIKLGDNATQRTVLGDKLIDFLKKEIAHTHPSVGAPSDKSLELAKELISETLLSKNVLIKEDLSK